MEVIVSRLAHPVTVESLRRLVDAAYENDLDLAHLLLRIDMPEMVGDMSRGEYAAELLEHTTNLRSLETGDGVYLDALREDNRHVPVDRLREGALDTLQVAVAALLEAGATALNRSL
jgi:hypothetical protein